jgi:hypothetical protein
MADKLLVDLRKGSNLRIRQFKNHDRLYWTSEKGEMDIIGNLRCKIKDLKDPALKYYIIKNGTYLN